LHQEPELVVFMVISEFYQENGYIAHLKDNSNAVIFDPGSDVNKFFHYLKSKNLTLEAICLTHAHPDHIVGVPEIKEAFPKAKIMIGLNEAAALTDPHLNLSSLLGEELVVPEAEITLVDNQEIIIAGINFRILEIPGHSPGHIAYVAKDSNTHIFGGDILFEGSVGRCDFPGGNFQKLISGIKSKLLCLPPDSKIYPGHGPTTTIQQEIIHNPFLA